MGSKAEIDAIMDKAIVDQKNKDWDAWVSMYAEDAVLGMPGMPMLKGRAAIKDCISKFGDAEFVSQTIDCSCDLSPEWHLRRGSYKMKIDGKEVTWWGITLFKKIGGKWQIHSDASALEHE